MPAPSKVPAKITVDFSKVEDRREGGAAVHVPPGDYLVQVIGCEQKTKQDDPSSKYLNWRLKIIKPEQYAKKPGVIYFVTSLKPEALWNLRNFLEDLGLKVPKSSVGVPIAQIIEKKMVIGVTLDDDEYNEKIKSKVQATFKKADYEDTGTVTTDSSDDDTEEETGEERESEDEEMEELDVDDL